jgi:hypothetical protein
MQTKEEMKREYAREYARKRRATDPVFLEKCRENGRKSRLKRLKIALQECRKWKLENKEKNSQYNKIYAEKNKDAIKQKRNANIKKRYATDPIFVLVRRERVRAYDALKGIRKSAKTETLLGCSYQEFKDHIEKQFCDGMGWHNMGAWHIDHIRPLASFNLADEAQQRLAFHYSNQRPLWAKENMKKGAKYA